MTRARPRLLNSYRPRTWRGTVRNPGPDLRKLPVGFDLAGISIAEGVRAAAASAALLLANHWIESPTLTLAAFSANFTCFCDTGGPVRSRIPALLAFTLLGGMVWGLLGLLHDAGGPVLVPLATAIVFCGSMARVWGLRAQAVGNVLTVVVALAVDKALDPVEALGLFAAFVVGGLWATLLTIGIWRIYPNRPSARMLAANWRLLASFVHDIGAVLVGDRAAAAWDGLARGDRRPIRDALEETRSTLLASLRPPGPLSPQAARNMLTLEVQEGIFGSLIAMSDVLEATSEPRPREVARRVLRRLRPILANFGHDARRGHRRAVSLARLSAEAAHAPALNGIVQVLADRLRVADRLDPEGSDAPGGLPFEARPSWRGKVLPPLLANLTWNSAILRHATRAALLVAVAVTAGSRWPSPYAHWLTITVALTMQPYFAATWQRALERIAGTLLGAAIGGALTFLPQTNLAAAVLLVPLSIIGFSVRQVSYGAYIACLTPLTVVLFDVAEPGHAVWVIAGMRTLYTIGGGVLAVLACMLLWPSWEPDRVERELRGAFLAHARYAEAVFALLDRIGPAQAVEDARRGAGIASNNLEAALSRALQEPRGDLAGRLAWLRFGRGRGRAAGTDARAARRGPGPAAESAFSGQGLELVLTADAALRRFSGALMTLQHEPREPEHPSRGFDAWRAWVSASLEGLAEHSRTPGPAPFAPPESTLARIGRAVAILGDVIAELKARDAAVR